MVKVKSSDRRAFKNPSHLTPTGPPVEPSLETSSNDPDPQSSRIEGSTYQIRYDKKEGIRAMKNEGIEMSVHDVDAFFYHD